MTDPTDTSTPAAEQSPREPLSYQPPVALGEDGWPSIALPEGWKWTASVLSGLLCYNATEDAQIVVSFDRLRGTVAAWGRPSVDVVLAVIRANRPDLIDAVFAERDRLHEFYAEAAYRTGIEHIAEGHNTQPGPMPDVLRAISETSAERDRLATEVAELRERHDDARREERDACIAAVVEVLHSERGRGAELALRTVAGLLRMRATPAAPGGPTT